MTERGGAAAPAVPGAALWLALQGAVVGRAAHEVRNALNAVAVNVEVLRSRLQREGAPPALAPFAAAAAAQLELLTEQVEALLAVTRAPAARVDVGAVARALAVLASTAERPVRVSGGADPAVTGASPEGARLAVAAVLAAALAPAEVQGVQVEVADGGDGAGPVLQIRCEGGAAASPSEDAVAAVRSEGIALFAAADGALHVVFPPPAR